MAILRTETKLSYTYETVLPNGLGGGNVVKVEKTFTGTDGECNWWLLSMQITHSGTVNIISTTAKLI
jgi:hypothetical protein